MAESQPGTASRESGWFIHGDGTLRFGNSPAVGEVVKDVDGYFYWWPGEVSGSLSGAALRGIADLLDRVNAEWDAEVRRDLGGPDDRRR